MVAGRFAAARQRGVMAVVSWGLIGLVTAALLTPCLAGARPGGVRGVRTRPSRPLRPGPLVPSGPDPTLFGGPGGGPFTNADAGGAPLVGLAYTMGSWGGRPVISSLDTHFLNQGAPAGEKVTAKSGYAVGGIAVHADDCVRALQLVFMRFKDQQTLDASDTYRSPWIGTPLAGQPREILTDGKLVTGIRGRKGMNLDAVGLVFAKGAEPVLPPPPPVTPITERPEMMVGGLTGTPYRLTGNEGARVMGLRFTVTTFMNKGALRDVDPLWAATAAAPSPSTVIAKPGYALGGISVSATTWVHAVQAVFMRVKGARLDPRDSYRSEWFGTPEPALPAHDILSTGKPVVGIRGRKGLNVNAMGLVYEGDPDPGTVVARPPVIPPVPRTGPPTTPPITPPVAIPTGTAHFVSPDGYSFDYPKSWATLDKNERDAAFSIARKTGVKVPDVNTNMISVMLFNTVPTASGFAPNMNVLVIRDRLPVNAANKRRCETEIRAGIERTGASVSNYAVTTITVGGREAFSITYDARMPGQAQLLRCWQVLVPAGSKVYTVSCAATQAEYANNEPAFRQIVNSLQVTAGGGIGGLFGGIKDFGTLMMIAGVVIVLVGGALALVKYLRKRQSVPALAGATPYAPIPGRLPPAPIADPESGGDDFFSTMDRPAAAPPPAPPTVTWPGVNAPLPPQIAAPRQVPPTDIKIEFRCACGVLLKAPKGAAGRQVQCPKCGATIVLP